MTPKKTKFGIHTFDFFPEDKKYAETYECVFCQIVSPNNYCLSCNHCVCEDCIIKDEKYEKCPKHNDYKDGKYIIIKGINSFSNDLIGKALLDNLKVNCIFKKKGCNWSGLFKDFKSSHLPKCEFYKNEIGNKIINDEESDNEKEENNDEKDENDNEVEENEEEIEENGIEIGDNEDEIEENYISYNSRDNSDNDNNNIFNKDENIYIEYINNQNNILLNKKRKFSNEKDKDKINEDILCFNDIKYKEKSFNINEYKSSSFYQNNIVFSKEVLLSDEDFDENKISSMNSENASYYENVEKTNNKILIDSNLTLNKFPYFYYFTEPLHNCFTCLIKTISRNILREDEEISFGLTNVNNNKYKEILSTNKYKFLFFKGDITRISYDNDLFIAYFENDKNNYISIPFQNNESIRYYPTIILNNKYDILEVSHD